MYKKSIINWMSAFVILIVSFTQILAIETNSYIEQQKSSLLDFRSINFVTASAITDPATFTQTGTGFFYPLGVTSWTKSGGTWLGRDKDHDTDGLPFYTYGYYHLGVDMLANVGDSVFAAANGEVVDINNSPDWGTGNVAVLVIHTRNDGTKFLAVYAHIVATVKKGDRLSGGVKFATVGAFSGGNHLHFSVISNISQRTSLGRAANSSWESTFNHLDPVGYINGKTPKCGDGTSQLYRPNNLVLSHPDGTLLKSISGATVYVKYKGQKLAIPSASRLYELYGPGRGFDFRDVVMVSDEEFNSIPTGPDVTSALPNNGLSFEPDGRIIRQRGGSEIAIVSNGMRRPFSSPISFLGRGYLPCNIATVDNYYSYPLGSAL